MADPAGMESTDWSTWTFATLVQALTADVVELRSLSRATWFVFDAAALGGAPTTDEVGYQAFGKQYFGANVDHGAVSTWEGTVDHGSTVTAGLAAGSYGPVAERTLNELYQLVLLLEQTIDSLVGQLGSQNAQFGSQTGGGAVSIQAVMTAMADNLQTWRQRLPPRPGLMYSQAALNAYNALHQANSQLSSSYAAQTGAGLRSKIQNAIDTELQAIHDHLVAGGLVAGSASYNLDSTDPAKNPDPVTGVTQADEDAYQARTTAQIASVLSSYARGDLRSPATWDAINAAVTATVSGSIDALDGTAQTNVGPVWDAYAALAGDPPPESTRAAVGTGNDANGDGSGPDVDGSGAPAGAPTPVPADAGAATPSLSVNGAADGGAGGGAGAGDGAVDGGASGGTGSGTGDPGALTQSDLAVDGGATGAAGGAGSGVGGLDGGLDAGAVDGGATGAADGGATGAVDGGATGAVDGGATGAAGGADGGAGGLDAGAVDGGASGADGSAAAASDLGAGAVDGGVGAAGSLATTAAFAVSQASGAANGGADGAATGGADGAAVDGGVVDGGLAGIAGIGSAFALAAATSGANGVNGTGSTGGTGEDGVDAGAVDGGITGLDTGFAVSSGETADELDAFGDPGDFAEAGLTDPAGGLAAFEEGELGTGLGALEGGLLVPGVPGVVGGVQDERARNREESVAGAAETLPLTAALFSGELGPGSWASGAFGGDGSGPAGWDGRIGGDGAAGAGAAASPLVEMSASSGYRGSYWPPGQYGPMPTQLAGSPVAMEGDSLAMLPPMAPMGGRSGQDRRRNSWLREDEDVWGAGGHRDGVVGRADENPLPVERFEPVASVTPARPELVDEGVWARGGESLGRVPAQDD